MKTHIAVNQYFPTITKLQSYQLNSNSILIPSLPPHKSTHTLTNQEERKSNLTFDHSLYIILILILKSFKHQFHQQSKPFPYNFDQTINTNTRSPFPYREAFKQDGSIILTDSWLERWVAAASWVSERDLVRRRPKIRPSWTFYKIQKKS